MPKPSPNSPQGTRVSSARLSITIPANNYRDLKTEAERQRVSVAWVVREAVRKYLDDARRVTAKKR